MIRILVTALVTLSASHALAAPKTMACTLFSAIEDQQERPYNYYRMAFDVDANRFGFAKGREKDPAFDPQDRWDILFVSEDKMRVVAAVRRQVPEESFLPPVEVVHADFGRSTFEMKGLGAGQTLDLRGAREVPTTNRTECRRLD